MKKLIKLKGNIWYAGDTIFIEIFDPKTQKFTEIDLVEFLKNNIEENSKISISVNPDDDTENNHISDFLSGMRSATEEEMEYINNYIKEHSIDTGISIFDFLENKEENNNE